MYGKIFEEIFDGSLMIKGGPMATYLFMSMIVLADENGVVRFTPEALGKRIGLSDGAGSFLQWEDFRESLIILESEDDGSNLSTEDGKRIIPMSIITNGEETRGWWIVNYEFYRKKASKFDQKDKTKERVRRFRERHNTSVTPCNACNDNETDSNEKKRHTDTDIKKIYKRKKACVWPKDFTLTNKMAAYAVDKGISPKKVDAFFDEFKDWADSKGATYVDWEAAFRTRVRKTPELGKQFLKQEGESTEVLLSEEERWLKKAGVS